MTLLLSPTSIPRRHASRLPALASLLLLLGACASQQPAPAASAAPARTPHPSGRWETVFLTTDAAATLAEYDQSELPGYDRRDADINFAPSQPLLATAQWPEPDRTDLQWQRYLVLPRHADTVIYFVPGPRWGW
jgi:hypothetical protein